MSKQKIVPHLWFDTQAEKAAKFYTSIFKHSKIKDTARYPKAAEEVSGKKVGSVMTVVFEIAGQEFMALNGGPQFKFSEAISFMVMCENQKEVDYFWKKLTAGGKEGPCGWLKDKFGLSWQIVPKQLEKMMKDKDRKKAERVTAAFLKMQKLDIAELEKAYAGR